MGQRRAGRLLVRLLCLLLVPVILVATPHVAQAATYGEAASASLEFTTSGQGYTGIWETAVFSAYWTRPDEGSPKITVGPGSIYRGWGSDAMGGPDCDSDDCSTLHLTFNGTGCQLSASLRVNGNWSIDGGTAVDLFGVNDSCVVTEVCGDLLIYRNNMPDSDYRETVCGPIDLGAPPAGPKTSTCPAGTPTWASMRETSPGPGYYEVKGKGGIANASGVEWYATAISNSGSPMTIKGIGKAITGGWGEISMWLDTGTPQNPSRLAGIQVVTPPSTQYVGGYTDPAICSFYFGKKIREDGVPGAGRDEPWGALSDSAPPSGGSTEPPVLDPPTEPEPQTEACSFSLGDPTTWLDGGMCAAVGFLRAIWQAIAGLPKRIGAAILDGLAALFIPTDAPSFSDVPNPIPTGWVPALPTLSAASCGALTVPAVSLGFRDWGTHGSTTLVNTCDDPWPLVRTFTYYGLLTILLVTVGWQCYRVVASGVGMGVSMGGGGDDD